MVRKLALALGLTALALGVSACATVRGAAKDATSVVRAIR